MGLSGALLWAAFPVHPPLHESAPLRRSTPSYFFIFNEHVYARCLRARACSYMERVKREREAWWGAMCECASSCNCMRTLLGREVPPQNHFFHYHFLPSFSFFRLSILSPRAPLHIAGWLVPFMAGWMAWVVESFEGALWRRSGRVE